MLQLRNLFHSRYTPGSPPEISRRQRPRLLAAAAAAAVTFYCKLITALFAGFTLLPHVLCGEVDGTPVLAVRRLSAFFFFSFKHRALAERRGFRFI